jgi:hypothetical protein
MPERMLHISATVPAMSETVIIGGCGRLATVVMFILLRMCITMAQATTVVLMSTVMLLVCALFCILICHLIHGRVPEQ